MPWIQISFHTEKTLAELLSNLLGENGAESITLQDDENQALLEPGVGETPIWDRVVVTGLFNSGIDPQKILTKIQSALHTTSLPDYQVTTLDDKVWEREWINHFQPMRFGQRTWICPSWYRTPDPNAVTILLDPGLAFGTGTHPTTALCLEWLDGHIQGGETVIDFGCGSGILGIGALKLGAKQVWAVDNDPQALIATQDNAVNNAVDTYICVVDTSHELKIQANILLANILAKPLISLSSYFATLVKPGGRAILSGILAEQLQVVVAAYNTNFYLQHTAQREDWIRLDLIRR